MNQLLNQILIMPHNQIAELTDIEGHESQFDFLSWVYESLSQEEEIPDLAADPLCLEQTIIELAQHYQPSTDANHYQQKIEARRARYEELAHKRQQESDAQAEESHRMFSVIPFGQPILVGHHSETRDRNYRSRASNKMRKAIQLADTAQYHARRAERVGKNGISSDDPNKIIKLRRKLAMKEQLQETMKAANKIIKSKKKGYIQEQRIADLMNLGLSQQNAADLFQPDFAGRIGFPSYMLTNNNAEISRIRQRIETEQINQEVAVQEDRTFTAPNGDEITLEFDATNNRIRWHFPSKPDESTRACLKRNGYTFSRQNLAWQRKITLNAKATIEPIIQALTLKECS